MNQYLWYDQCHPWMRFLLWQALTRSWEIVLWTQCVTETPTPHHWVGEEEQTSPSLLCEFECKRCYSMYKANIHLICRFCYNLAAYIERASAFFPCSGGLAMGFLSFLILKDTDIPKQGELGPACWSNAHGPQGYCQTQTKAFQQCKQN